MKRRAASLLGGRLRGLMASVEEGTALSGSGSGVLGSRSPAIQRRNPAAVSQVRSAAVPAAQQVATKLQPNVLPLTRIDEVGAISIVEPHEKDFVPKEFENVDGRRIEDGRYAAFIQDVSGEAPFKNQITALRNPPLIIVANPNYNHRPQNNHIPSISTSSPPSLTLNFQNTPRTHICRVHPLNPPVHRPCAHLCLWN